MTETETETETETPPETETEGEGEGESTEEQEYYDEGESSTTRALFWTWISLIAFWLVRHLYPDLPPFNIKI